MIEELKPCPFCGNLRVDFSHEASGNKVLFFRFCVYCGAQGPDVRTETEAVPAWNDRAPDPAYTARIAALEAEVERLREALEASLTAGDSHYAHWDKMGTAGTNCPACISRREANDLARAALAGGEKDAEG